ncbi:MAG TPA: phosphate acyltransferase PlsX [Anaerolineaceae bacterium]|nr:phosphate acyltransferase PlsX [Anaerolineaceae bacterium]
MTIILDAMGSDLFPEPEVTGALEAAELYGEKIILVGKSDLVEPRLKALNTRNLPVSLVQAPEMLEMGDKAVASAKEKPHNSMAIGMELVKSGEGAAFVTAGNTGAALFVSAITLKRMAGVQRPVLTAIFPTRKGRVVVCDIGANADCRPEFFPEFGIMGSIYAEKVLGVKNPRVGLIANGEEKGKGNLLVKSAYPLMETSGLNFIGNVEPKDLFGGAADVVICDGFTGNIMLKSSEAVASLMKDLISEGIKSSLVSSLGGLMVKPALKKVLKQVDPSEVGAAPLLGVNGLVFVGHGRSNAHAITSAIGTAVLAVRADLLGHISKAIQERMIKPQVVPPGK